MVLFCALSTQSQISSKQVNDAALPPEQQRILCTIVDKQSRVVALRAEDVRVFEDDKPQQVIAVRKLEDQLLSLAILIDISASQERTLPTLKAAADSFVQAIMRPGKDQGALITFTGTATVEQELTTDPTLVRQAISRVRFIPPGHLGEILGTGSPNARRAAASTAIWDAIWATSEELMPSAVGTRKAIILLSDGDDTFSRVKRKEAIEHAVRANAAVYVIGIGDTAHYDGVDKPALRDLSEKTGARAFFPKKVKDLTTAFAEIQQELRVQYEITYRSTSRKTGDSRKVRLEIINPALRPRELQISYQRIGPAPAK